MVSVWCFFGSSLGILTQLINIIFAFFPAVDELTYRVLDGSPERLVIANFYSMQSSYIIILNMLLIYVERKVFLKQFPWEIQTSSQISFMSERMVFFRLTMRNVALTWSSKFKLQS